MRRHTGPSGGRYRRPTDRVDPPRFLQPDTWSGTPSRYASGADTPLRAGAAPVGLPHRHICVAPGVGCSDSLVTEDHGEVCSLSGGVMLQPLSAPLQHGVGFFPDPIPATPSAALASRLPLWGGLRAYHVALKRPRGLGPASTPVARRLRRVSSEHPVLATYLLVQAIQHLGLVLDDGACSSSLTLTLPRTPGPRPPCDAGSRDLGLRSGRHPFRNEDTLSRGLQTSPLPGTHASVGDCWQNSRYCHLLRRATQSHQHHRVTAER